MDNAREGITVSDVRLPDNPLVYVNRGFTAMTGYSTAEALMKNCRYLQGEDTDPATVKEIRRALNDQGPFQTEILNYKKSGEPFWNHLSITPIFDNDGKLSHFIGIQEDITAQKSAMEKSARLEREKLTARARSDGEESERHRIGMELHDNVNQLLGTVRLYLTMARSGSDYSLDPLAEGETLLKNAIEEIRSLSSRLIKPQFHSMTDLVDQLETRLAHLRITQDISILFDFTGDPDLAITDDIGLVIFRTVQEQANNILKYAKATEAAFLLTVTGTQVRLIISDNGQGFDTSKPVNGIGLRNMKSRAASVNGELLIDSTPGAGTVLTLTIPAIFPEQDQGST